MTKRVRETVGPAVADHSYFLPDGERHLSREGNSHLILGSVRAKDSKILLDAADSACCAATAGPGGPTYISPDEQRFLISQSEQRRDALLVVVQNWWVALKKKEPEPRWFVSGRLSRFRFEVGRVWPAGRPTSHGTAVPFCPCSSESLYSR